MPSAIEADLITALESMSTPRLDVALGLLDRINLDITGAGFAASQLDWSGVTDTRVWKPPDAAGELEITAVAAVAISTALASTHRTVLATVGGGGITLTLPAASAALVGRTYHLFKVDSGGGSLTIARTGSDTINGVAANKTIATQWNGCRIQCVTATGWLASSLVAL